MNEDETHKLELIINGAKEDWDSLSEWEADFLISIEERFKKYGERARISFKQWGVLNRLYDRVVGN